MYRRAVITDEISQDLELAVNMAADFGLEGIEVRTAWDTRIDRMSKEQLRRVKETAAARGLVVASLASPVFKCAIDDPNEVAEHFEILKRCMDAAHALDTRLVRAFTFWRVPDPVSRIGEICDRFVEATAAMAGSDLTLVIENEHTCNVATSDEIASFLKRLGASAVRALWDPCNAYWSGEADAVGAGYERVRPFIAHVHVKDAIPGHDGGHAATVLGDGEVGVVRQLEALGRDGYDGFVSLETHYRVHAPLDDELVKRPGGSAFSEGGEEGTRRCLIAWNAMNLHA
jgi:sugar phosphate isomerase/epimerase